MNTLLSSAFRLFALAATLAMVPAGISAPDTASDPAAQQLALHGTVSVKAAGPYVEPGTYLIQVAIKLGEPSARLADGTWLYHHRTIAGSAVRGTLVVRFHQGRVSELALVTPAVALAMTSPWKPADQAQFATRN